MDTFLVLSSIAEEVLKGASLSYIRIVRMMRLIKVMRVIRVLRVFKELRMMTLCVLNALSSLLWALLLLVMVMYVFALVSMEGASQHFSMNDARLDAEKNIGFDPSITGEDDPPAEEVRRLVTEMYRTLPRAMLTSFYCISGGISWGESLRPLMTISPMYALIFSFYISFVVFGVLNVLTGIFVERAMSLSDRDMLIQSEQDKNMAFLTDMVELFHEMNDDDSPTVTWDELSTYLTDANVIAYFQSQGLDVTDARFIFELLDVDGSEELTIDEFCVGCHRLRGAAKCLDVCHILKETCDISDS